MDLALEARGSSVLLNQRAVTLSISHGLPVIRQAGYESVEDLGGHAFRAIFRSGSGWARCLVNDIWAPTERGVSLKRSITVDGESSETGINVGFVIPLDSVSWRFFIPGACYDHAPVEDGQGHAVVTEERTAFPLVMAYDEASGRGILLLRLTPARQSSPLLRGLDGGGLLQVTEIGALGFDRRLPSPSLSALLPHAELPTSRMRSSTRPPFLGLLPMDRTLHLEATYLVEGFTSRNFGEACFQGYARASELLRPRPVRTAVELDECVRTRMGCLASLATSWNGHTGFALNFDPRVARDAPPSGYGTGFTTLKSAVFPRVLEYGFTGRQLNNAYMLATCGALWGMPGWVAVAKDICGSFLRSCVMRSGFLHTLYDVVRHRPISPFGDEIGSSLHYGVPDAPAGNYVRNMAEAGFDLCLLSSIDKDPAIPGAALGLARFLLRAQNRDGSWYRAYTEDGTAVTAPAQWFGGTDRANKSATSTAIPFLVRLYGLIGDISLLDAARRAGDWLLRETVQSGDYRGGTLDNPNVVDKEGMAYPMMALLALYDSTRNQDYLVGAESAGSLALTWNCLWDVPFEEGTRLRELSFASRGWGGISILWGTGVVDTYSLWFLPEWERLAVEIDAPVFHDVTQLILYGTQQILSLPGNLHGLCEPGMQEEGFACSHQGIDDGLISKGDTWGSLGWVFAAGTYGVWNAIHGENKG